YFDQALALDPRNMVLLVGAAKVYANLRQFPTALKLYNRALDITPKDPSLMAAKASVFQAEGNLQEAARFLSEINEETVNEGGFPIKVIQLRLERNYSEAVRLLRARLALIHQENPSDKNDEQVDLSLLERFAGDPVGAKITAEQARNTLETLCKSQPDGYW